MATSKNIPILIGYLAPGIMLLHTACSSEAGTDVPGPPAPSASEASGASSPQLSTGGTSGGSGSSPSLASGGSGGSPLEPELETGGTSSGGDAPVDCTVSFVESIAPLLHLDAQSLGSESVESWENQGEAGGSFVPGKAPSLQEQVFAGHPAVRFESGAHLVGNVPINGLESFSIALVSATRLLQKPGNEWCQSDGFQLRLTENGCSGTYNLPIMWGETGDWGFAYLGPVQEQVAFRFGPGGKTYTQPGELLMTLDHDPNVAWARPESIGDSTTLTLAVKTATELKIWVDGKLIYAADIPGGSGPIKNVSDTVELGSGRREDLRWVGDIAEVLAYGQALSDSQAQALNSHLTCKYFSASP